MSAERCHPDCSLKILEAANATLQQEARSALLDEVVQAKSQLLEDLRQCRTRKSGIA